MTPQELKAKYPALVFKVDDAYVERALEFARRRGLEDALMKQFAWLGKGTFFGNPSECLVFSDGAPFSFYFEHRVNGRMAMNGGLIYFGPGDGGSGAPQFSTRMWGDTKEGWAIHT